MGFDTGPYVVLATFCDQVIEDKTGVLSVIRIVDQLTLSVKSGEGVPDELPPGAGFNSTFAVGLKAGEARGRQTVQIIVEHPDGSRHPGPELQVHFSQGPTSGANVVLKLGLILSTTGLYWTNVLVNGRLVTRVPLDVRYEVIQPGIQLR